jgi:hypothetical protein
MDALPHVTRLKAQYDNVHVHAPKLVSTILHCVTYTSKVYVSYNNFRGFTISIEFGFYYILCVLLR